MVCLGANQTGRKRSRAGQPLHTCDFHCTLRSSTHAYMRLALRNPVLCALCVHRVHSGVLFECIAFQFIQVGVNCNTWSAVHCRGWVAHHRKKHRTLHCIALVCTVHSIAVQCISLVCSAVQRLGCTACGSR